jgi:preprotein translocase subunit SecG
VLNTLISVVHVIACIFLILVVLLQQGRAGGLGALGGATQQVFGGRGAGNLLTRLTAIFATLFMVTSISLAYLASAGDIKLRSAKIQPSPTAPLPTTPLPAGEAPPASSK